MSDVRKTRKQLLVLVFGPSGIGKTTAFQFAKGQVPNAVFASLDDVVVEFGRRNGMIGEGQEADALLSKLRADGFLRTGIQAGDELLATSQGRTVVLDVGAGFLESALAGAWLSTCRCVVFNASPEVAYARQRARHPGETRSLERYTSQEFSSRRREYYAQANHTVDAERGADEVGGALVQVILEMAIQGPPSSSG